MKLDNATKRQLRVLMTQTFTESELDLFLQDWLNTSLDDIAPLQDLFEMKCQRILLWAERKGLFRELLEALAANHPNPGMRTYSAGALAAATPQPTAAPGANSRPYMVNLRPMVDRGTLWQHLQAFANGTTNNRVLVVTGGVGKTYSRWPVSYFCGPPQQQAKLACVDANESGVTSVDAGRLANLIATRLWGDTKLGKEKNLATANRIGRDVGSVIVQRLAALEQPTWLVIDELNLVNLDQSAIELLGRLCQAVDGSECPNVWLLLFGLNPSKLGSRGSFLVVDQVARPQPQDIEDYLTWFAQSIKKTPPPAALAASVAQLDAALTADPNHETWQSFHAVLRQQCSAIAAGVAS